MLGRHPSAIYRELKRNRNHRGQYGALPANRMARARRYNKDTGFVLKNPTILSYVQSGLQLGWSPEQISGRLPLDHPGLKISHEAIYLYVYQEARKGNSTWVTMLPTRRHSRRARYRGKSSARTSSYPADRQKISIHERPEQVNARIEPGHWESDLIIGKGNASAVMVGVERTTRYVYLSPLIGGLGADSAYQAYMAMFGALPRSMRKTLTIDNGSENACYKKIMRDLGVSVYFCDPYKSWQKGSVENMNRLVRRVFPKKTNFLCVDPKDVLQLQRSLNHRPRKCLGYRTPHEKFSQVCANAP